MGVSKKIRQRVLEKYQCRCGYCGDAIDIKTMQVDHIFPQRLSHFIGKQEVVSKNLQGKIPDICNINDFNNLMPACRACNHYKRGCDIEGFRQTLLTLKKRIEANYINKVGVKYRIITQPQEWDGIFYFER